MSEPDVPTPEVYQAELDPPTLARLFEDLATHAEVLEVRAKHAERAMTGEGTIDLDEARALLETRAVRGVQVRYRHEGELWLDTLMVGPTYVRLVRTRVPEPP
ncbi:MAG: hypothetical protein KF729_35675 [Sandaracinaceae bacterium]|nr:hypothetical protein [Sandaracinaceae bacterium]